MRRGGIRIQYNSPVVLSLAILSFGVLLEKKLVARTWGNFSARLDEAHFAITPSGLGYEQMGADDIVRFCLADESWEGSRKPSSVFDLPFR